MIQKLILGTTLLGSALAFGILKGHKDRQLRDVEKEYGDLVAYYLDAAYRLTDYEFIEHAKYLRERVKFDLIVTPDGDEIREIKQNYKDILDSISIGRPNTAI